MDLDSGIIAALTLGFLLGLKHATDADHVVAVSTIAREFGSAWRGIWVGASWGLGHSTPLLILGVVILLLKDAILDGYADAAPVLEFGVGVMLVLLGAQVFWNLKRGRLHVHAHGHDHRQADHLHIHASHPFGSEPVEQSALQPSLAAASPSPASASRSLLRGATKPAFRPKSYLIGMVHGLAGSAAVMLVLLPEIDSVWVGVGYLILFGFGTIASMAAITLVLGVPFAVANRFRHMESVVASIAGGASLAWGFALMSDLALGTALLPFS